MIKANLSQGGDVKTYGLGKDNGVTSVTHALVCPVLIRVLLTYKEVEMPRMGQFHEWNCSG